MLPLGGLERIFWYDSLLGRGLGGRSRRGRTLDVRLLPIYQLVLLLKVDDRRRTARIEVDRHAEDCPNSLVFLFYHPLDIFGK